MLYKGFTVLIICMFYIAECLLIKDYIVIVYLNNSIFLIPVIDSGVFSDGFFPNRPIFQHRSTFLFG